MQHYTIFISIVNALHPACLLEAWHIPGAVCTVLVLLMIGGETARNM